MDLKEMYREIVNEHNLHPEHKYDLNQPTKIMRGVNPSCGDDINLQLKIDNGVITDGSYNGSGCAISQASCDMMLDLIIGKTEDEARALLKDFNDMIHGEATQEQLDSLDEAAALSNISRMPARVKCALLGWRTLGEVLDEDQQEKTTCLQDCNMPNCPQR